MKRGIEMSWAYDYKGRLSIEKKEFGGPQVSRVVHDLDTKDLLERGMVEEFTTAAERRAACGTV